MAEKRVFSLSKIKFHFLISHLEISPNFETLGIAFTIGDPKGLYIERDDTSAVVVTTAQLTFSITGITHRLSMV